MIRVLLPITVSLFWLTDSVFGNNVQQSPLDLIKTSGNSVELQCLHNIPNYNVILWYKKNAVQEFVLLGYLWDDREKKEPAFKDKITLKGDATSKEPFTESYKAVWSEFSSSLFSSYHCSQILSSTTKFSRPLLM
ncbi:hypothetical protein SRHO_G00138030 [Serrasalmus rhombeus]